MLVCLPLLAALSAPADTVTYAYDDAGRLLRVQYSGGKTITYAYDKAGNLLRRLVTGAAQPGPAPTATAGGVVNAASFLGGPVAAGEIVTIFGTGIGPGSLVGLRLTRAGLVDNFLSDTQITFDGAPSPLIYVSELQTSAIVPYAVAGKSSTEMIVEYQGRRSAPVALPVTASAPALFSTDSTGKGGGAILNEDSSVNTPSNAAAKGAIVVLFGTGEGQTDPPGVDGKPAADVLPKPTQTVSVRIGGQQAEVVYAGAAPGFAGLLQINARIPAGVASGNVPVVVTAGSASSQPDLTVAVR